jgi:hypothetical protein
MVVVVVILLLLVFVLRIVRRRFQKCKIPGKEWNNSPGSQLRVLQAFNPGGSPSSSLKLLKREIGMKNCAGARKSNKTVGVQILYSFTPTKNEDP